MRSVFLTETEIMPEVPHTPEATRAALAAAATRIEQSARRDESQLPGHPELSDLARALADAAKAVADAANRPIG